MHLFNVPPNRTGYLCGTQQGSGICAVSCTKRVTVFARNSMERVSFLSDRYIGKGAQTDNVVSFLGGLSIR